MCLFDIMFTKAQVIFIKFPIALIFKSGKIYFIEDGQQHIDLIPWLNWTFSYSYNMRPHLTTCGRMN